MNRCPGFKRTFIILICAGIYIARLYQVHRYYEPMTQKEYYQIGDTFREKNLDFQVTDAQMTTLRQLIEEYGEPEMPIPFDDTGMLFYLVNLNMTNSTEETITYPTLEITLQTDAWYTQMLLEMLRPINGEKASSKQRIGSGETLTMTYIYPVSIRKGYEYYLEKDWYLGFRMDSAKKLVLVKPGQ